MDAHEIVPERIERDHVRAVFELLAERIRQPGKAPHRHPHREVGPFRIGRAHMLGLGVAGDVTDPRTDAFGGARSDGSRFLIPGGGQGFEILIAVAWPPRAAPDAAGATPASE